MSQMKKLQWPYPIHIREKETCFEGGEEIHLTSVSI